MMRKMLLVVGIATIVLGWAAAHAAIVEGEPRVEIWTDRGTGGIYRVGDDVEVCLRADRDCYVIVYEIDTDGYLRLLFPYYCGGDGFVEAGQVYRMGRGYYGRYYITGPSGVEYIHALASFRPFRTLYWEGCDGYETYARDVSWQGFSDYWGCALPPRVYGDPYMAMQSIDEFICYDALDAGLAFADFTYFYVDERVSYPRYVCYDCHGFDTPYRPYVHVCTGFSIRFVNCDPCWNPWSWWWWCTPRRAYCGPRYVCSARRTCKGWPSEYKWKSRSDCYTSRSEYSQYWDERVRVDVPRVVEASAEKYKTQERDLYGREPKQVVQTVEPGRDTKHKDVAVREGRVEIIRPVDVPTREVEKVKEQEARKATDRETPAKPEKVEPKRVVVKPDKKAEKVDTEKSTERGRDSGTARKVEVRASSRATSSANRKVAPSVRTSSDKGRSPSKRRSVSD
jgi:hypothetical protein